jgi:hypothetical protein
MTPVEHVKGLPGVDIAQTGITQSNVVARGFNNVFSGALLVMTDNRYTHVPSLRFNANNMIPGHGPGHRPDRGVPGSRGRPLRTQFRQRGHAHHHNVTPGLPGDQRLHHVGSSAPGTMRIRTRAESSRPGGGAHSSSTAGWA